MLAALFTNKEHVREPNWKSDRTINQLQNK